jgi:hypothetical protein
MQKILPSRRSRRRELSRYSREHVHNPRYSEGCASPARSTTNRESVRRRRGVLDRDLTSIRAGGGAETLPEHRM